MVLKVRRCGLSRRLLVCTEVYSCVFKPSHTASLCVVAELITKKVLTWLVQSAPGNTGDIYTLITREKTDDHITTEEHTIYLHYMFDFGVIAFRSVPIRRPAVQQLIKTIDK